MPVLSDIQLRLQGHEQWLIGLRQAPGMTTAKIQAKLDSEKHLKATSSQLETYFRQLGQRKNLSRHEWIAVFRALDSQRKFGQHFDLYISGKLITEPELKKKRKNAKPPQPLVEVLADAERLIKQLPNGVTVKKPGTAASPLRSPQRSITPLPISQELANVNQNLGAGSMLENVAALSDLLPSQDVIVHDRGMGSSPVGSLLGSPSNRNQSRLLGFPSDMEELLIVQSSCDFGDIGTDACNEFPPFSPGALDRLLGPSSPGPSLRDLQYLDPAGQRGFWTPGLNYASPTNITLNHGPHDLSPIEAARLLLGSSSSVIPRPGWHTPNASLPTAEALLDKLHSLMIVNAADGGFCGQLGIFDGAGVITDQFIQMLLFSIVNNFAGLDGISVELVIKFINEHDPARRRVLRHLRNEARTMYSRALAERLLAAAITACDARIVKDLLALGITRPDDIVCVDYRPGEHEYPRTAVEQAASLRQLEIVELLLRCHADVNKTCQPLWSRDPKGALECAIGLWGQHRPIDIRLVDMLLKNGATVKGRLMVAAIRWGDTAVVERLMSKMSPSEHEFRFCALLVNAAEHLRNDIGHRFVRWVIQACRDTHNSKCINSDRMILEEALWKAARRNNRDLVDLLLPHGGQQGLDMALTAAARFGSHTLVQFFIAHGASVNGEPCYIDGEDLTTPLAEAIRHNNDELMDMLAKEGAWDQIEEPKRLEAATRAIAESGNSACLHKIRRLVPNPCWQTARALAPALFLAIKAGNEEITLELLKAGADPHSLRNDSPLLESLRKKSQTITWALVECDMSIDLVMDERVLEEAIAWGDLEIVKALFFLGNGINAYWGRPPLAFAIKAGNRSLIDFMISLGADLDTSRVRELPDSGFYERRGSYVFANGRKTFISDGSELFSSPLAAAVLVRDEATASYLLDHGADPADEQAIINAIIHDRGLLDLILQTFQQRYPRRRGGFGGRVLIHTLSTRDEGALDLCLKAGFDVNSMTFDKELGMVTALGFAIRKYPSRLETVSKLLSAGGDSNLPASMEGGVYAGTQAPDERITARRTALLDAIETTDLPLLELLISRGAQVDKEAKLGLKHTPLQKACEIGIHNIVDLLLRHNADVNAAPAVRGGATALQLAAKIGSVRMAKKLLDLGAQVNAPGARSRGRSAIEYAAEYGRLHMIPLLFNAAGGKFLSDQCTSAIALAQENGHLACAGLLTELSTRNQAFLDASSTAEEGGTAVMVS